MKILLDTCVWGGTTEEVANEGHDVVWAGDPDISPPVAVLAIALPATVQTVIGNVLEPKMMGKSLQLMAAS